MGQSSLQIQLTAYVNISVSKCVTPHLSHVLFFPFDLFTTLHRFWQGPHICSLITICKCVCVHTVCVLGKHPELKRISEGTLPRSKQHRIQLTGTQCVAHNNHHGNETVSAANPQINNCHAAWTPKSGIFQKSPSSVVKWKEEN